MYEALLSPRTNSAFQLNARNAESILAHAHVTPPMALLGSKVVKHAFIVRLNVNRGH